MDREQRFKDSMSTLFEIAEKVYAEASQEDWFKETMKMCGNSPEINFIEGFILALGLVVDKPEILELSRALAKKDKH
jgi:hypothetical protein